jgi:hypothetical protein
MIGFGADGEQPFPFLNKQYFIKIPSVWRNVVLTDDIFAINNAYIPIMKIVPAHWELGRKILKLRNV